ncbi:hypothetical protein EVA_07200 [gut metagenome]|uniref:Uncharacterized protein n=1 Tax=gut metagenome TaxID=749906 RepID=J9GQE7_9ZZZZ
MIANPKRSKKRGRRWVWLRWRRESHREIFPCVRRLFLEVKGKHRDEQKPCTP